MEGMVYIYAWVVYLLSAIGIVAVMWRLTRNLAMRRTRRTLRALIVVIAFTPINIAQQGIWLAPAYLVGAYDFVLGDVVRAQQAGLYLAAAFILLIILTLLESVLRRLFNMDYGK
jgi:ABC-type iron transport system FetAB permease component